MATDIMRAFNSTPRPLDFVFDGFLSGSVGALVSPGGSGKSFFALEAAMSVACSVPGGDLLGLKPPHHGPVVYLSAEDPEPVIVHRLHALGKHLKTEAKESIAENLRIETILGKRLNIADEKHLARIIDYCHGTRLAVFDTLSRIHTLDENSNGNMAQVIAILEYVAAKTGAAVLFLHHTSKVGGRDFGTDQSASRGASVLVDNVRWSSFLRRMTESEAEDYSDNRIDRSPILDRRGFFVRFGVGKQNYSVLQNDKWFKRNEGGVLLPVELKEARKTKQEKGVRREEI